MKISTPPIYEDSPLIVRGENVCPPQDGGGTFGYKELKEILLNTKHPEYKSTKKCDVSTFEPTVCALKTTQQNLGTLGEFINDYNEGL